MAEEDDIELVDAPGHWPPHFTGSKPKSSSAAPDSHAGPSTATWPPNSAREGRSTPKPASSASTSTAVPKQVEAGDTADSSETFLECPICGRMLETDNQGLNEHIDFCLSRQAIKEAQASSLKPNSRSSQRGPSPSRKGHKPQSRGARGHGTGLLGFRKQG